MKNRRSHFTPTRIFFIFIFSFLAADIFAANLSEYRQRVRQARESLEVILFAEQDEYNRAENAASEREAIDRTLGTLTSKEKIEWQGGSVEAENLWLAEKLKEFREEKDQAKKRVVLNGIIERLAALENKLDEILGNKSGASPPRGKDEDKQKLAEILRREEYQKPAPKQENLIQRKWREFREWLRKNFPKSDPVAAPSEEGVKSVSVVMQFVLFGVVLAIIGYLFYRFAPFLRERFKRRVKTASDERIILGEKLAADETSENLFAEAERLARQGDLRGAIRKGYIALLCDLSDRKIIGLARHKTNRDYLRDVRGMRELHDDLRNLTGSFERHWYGLTATGAEDWQAFRDKYQTAKGRQK